jgi:hypothetical protein
LAFDHKTSVWPALHFRRRFSKLHHPKFLFDQTGRHGMAATAWPLRHGRFGMAALAARGWTET